MKEKIREFVAQNGLFDHTNRILVGVSGGVDSMVLLHLLLGLGLKGLGVAHCNFSLRGQESDGDEALVKDFAQAHDLPFYSVRFDTKGEAAAHGESIQMAARRLRYQWFEELLRGGWDMVAIAHHGDDVAETILINMVRGTGLRGLTGIAPRRGNVVRPMLFATREDVMEYARNQGVEYRNDSTNDSTKYLRNFLRHKVLPLLRECTDGDFNSIISGNCARLSQTQCFLDGVVERASAECMEGNEIDVEKLKQWGGIDYLLYELLWEFGFSGSVVADLVRSVESGRTEGKLFFSEKYVANLNRGKIFVLAIQTEAPEMSIVREESECVEHLAQRPSIEQIKGTARGVAYVEARAVEFPLVLRQWQNGDSFCPLGMGGHSRLVSDFLIDIKMPIIEKQRQMVLQECSTGRIVWLVGRRLDERFAIKVGGQGPVLRFEM